MSDSIYRQKVKERLDALIPIFAKAAVGDFSQDVVIPEEEDEFTGLLVGIQMILDTIREKLKGYEELNRQLRVRYEEKNALLQSIGEGVVVLDTEGKVSLFNHAASDLLGWTEAEMIGKKWIEMVPVEKVDGTRIESSLRPVAVKYPPSPQNGSNGYAGTYYYVRKNGTRFPMTVTITQLKLEGQDQGLVVVFHDVTREKQVEELKEDFLSLASHQLRSPLVTMRWTMEAMMEDSGREIPEALKKKIDVLYQNNQHMIGLVNDILSVSRISQGKIAEQKQPTNLVYVLQSTLAQMQPEADHRQIKFVVKIEDGLIRDQKYLMDASLFSHCIQNIISNAIKYGNQGSQVTVTLTPKNEKICVIVADQGIGIPEADKEHIFEKFYRGQNVAQMDFPGSGLGLFVVKSILDRWGGTISLESQENVGTTVSLCIPFEMV